MAVARPQTGSVITGVHVALIVFVVLTVGSLAGVVVMLTQREDLVQRAQRARDDATRATATATEKETAYNDFTNLLTGQTGVEASAVQAQVQSIRKELSELAGLPSANEYPSYAILTALDRLSKAYKARSEETKQLQDQVAALQAKVKEIEDTYRQREQDLVAKTDELNNEYKSLKTDYDANLQRWTEGVQKFEKELAALNDKNRQLLTQEQSKSTSLQQEATRQQERIDGLVKELEKFRPSNDPMAVLREADGRVLRVLPDESVVYISLGRADHVTPGMTFAVYSPVGGVSKDGKGKATIEVMTVLTETSECRVTSVEKGDVIVDGDLIANPVYDRTRTFTFVVTGGFDLNYDGKIDDPNGDAVRKLVEAWGGRVASRVDEQTDFVVVGSPPVVGPPGGVASPEPAESKQLQDEQQLVQTAAYDKIKADAKALRIPILTRTQFLYFIGRPVPANAEPDAPV